jgi:16S rRNA (cytosine1402-N4)-methyltransferase
VARVDRILLDLGVSSLQLDDPARGFSFQQCGALDMRMNPLVGPTAAEWLARASEEEMMRIFWEYGEERFGRRIARRIAEARRGTTINTTERLADIVRGAVPRSGRIDPATRVFQALRIAVNDELGELERGLVAALASLRPGGRLAVLAFHSLEDRRVKTAFRAGAAQGDQRLICRKPVRPSAEECSRNRRARSAKLRVCEVIRPLGRPGGPGYAPQNVSPSHHAPVAPRPLHRP